MLAYLGSGIAYTTAHVLIAAAMAAIVLIVFMELDRGKSLLWVFAGAGFFWLALLFVLTAADYLTRYSFAPELIQFGSQAADLISPNSRPTLRQDAPAFSVT